ncbi:cyclin-dependent kinase 5 activator 1-like [Salminus brasiliensis]|uniref:cyclin-dependent kinase 5 activator 1-like n=1 Tax=Salminus brasiliensis TaxID=930266 RepID=UPI003B833CF9
MENPCSISLPAEVTPGQEDKKRSSKKRPITLLLPATLPAKRTKISTSPPEDDVENPQAGPSTSTTIPPEAVSDQAKVAATPKKVRRNPSTSELPRLFGEFLCQRCHLIQDLSWEEPIAWIRFVDRFFYKAGWQPHRFITASSLVFLYMLCRDTISADVASKEELKATLLSCFYVSIAYVGSEVSYPARLFISDGNRTAFWDRTLGIAKCMSEKMLQLNTDPQYFSKVVADLKNRKDR